MHANLYAPSNTGPSRSASAPRVVVVMGVSGAGKTEVGRALATSMQWRFIDADDYHSAANREKMHRGEGLTDDDRAPWLATLRETLSDALAHREHVVLACSALKQAYRETLIPADAAAGDVRFVYLDVPVDVLRNRLKNRTHHFAGPDLLQSQLATLEKPHDAIVVDGTKPVDEIVETVRRALER